MRVEPNCFKQNGTPCPNHVRYYVRAFTSGDGNIETWDTKLKQGEELISISLTF